ncbi:MAG: class II aldolase/adducin family protein, partial [Rhabdaerophilum sp.]
DHPAILIANHGPVVASSTLEAAVFAMEELEETARLIHLAQGLPIRHLTQQQVTELKTKFPIR